MKTQQLANEFSIIYKDGLNCIHEIRGFSSRQEANDFFTSLNNKHCGTDTLLKIKNFTNCNGKTIVPNLDNY